MLFLDSTRSVGLATSADLNTARLVVVAANSASRELRVLEGQERPTVAALTVADGKLFWLEISADDDGNRQTTVWRADVAGGAPTLLATDPSDVLYFDSDYDLQVIDGKVMWAAAPSGGHDGGEIRSIPVTGGPVSVRALDRLYALTTWPWATSSGSSRPGDVELLNLKTGEKRTVRAGSSEILACSPLWCRVTTLVNQGQSLTFEVERADGTDRRLVGNTARTPLNTDVALLDRFEVLSTTTDAAGNSQRLWLYDLKDNRSVVLDDTSTATIGSRGSFLWWATGDNETLAWHILDLKTLT
jgi:hypothetical protein